MNDVERPQPHDVKQLALVLRPERDLTRAVNEIRAWAAATGVTVVGCEGEPRLSDDVKRRPVQTLAEGSDAVLALGGDGTMLGALRLAAPHRVPVLGVNLGTFGYLTEVDGDHLDDAVDSLARHRWSHRERAE